MQNDANNKPPPPPSTSTTTPTTTARTIDDFLEQVYQEYKKKFRHYNVGSSGSGGNSGSGSVSGSGSGLDQDSTNANETNNEYYLGEMRRMEIGTMSSSNDAIVSTTPAAAVDTEYNNRENRRIRAWQHSHYHHSMSSGSSSTSSSITQQQIIDTFNIQGILQRIITCCRRLPRRIITTFTSNCRYSFCCCDYYRRYHLPLPLLALCVANSSDATEILMLSYLLANPSFRHDMFRTENNANNDTTINTDYNLHTATAATATTATTTDNLQNNNDNSSSSIQGAEYLAASIFLGMLLGGTLLGFLSDQIGRRPALLLGLLLNAAAGLFSSLPIATPSVRPLIAGRFFAGVGIGSTVPPLFSLASEWSPRGVRGGVVTAVASFWMVGSLFVAGLAWCLFRETGGGGGGGAAANAIIAGDGDGHGGEGGGGNDESHPTIWGMPVWRVFAALCALPSALGAWMVYRYVPESPRYLASVKKEYGHSARVCNTMAKSLGIQLLDGGREAKGDFFTENDSFLASGNSTVIEGNARRARHPCLSMNAIPAMTESELQHDFLSNKTGETSNINDEPRSTSQQLFQTLHKLYSFPLLSRTTLPLQTIWFSLSFGTYGITTWINTLFVAIHLQNIYWNSFLFALANLPGNIMSIMYSDKWGRKKMLVGSLVGAAGSLMGFAYLVYSSSNNDGGANNVPVSQMRTYAIVLFACAFQMFSIVSWNAIDILSGELFPTRVRSAGMGVCTAAGRLGAMVAQFVNAWLMMTAGGDGNADSGGDGKGQEAVASAWVLAVAAMALILGAGMPMFLERDMAGGELKDDVSGRSTADGNGRNVGCGIWKRKKDHTSDDENDLGSNGSIIGERDTRLQSVRGVNEYQSFREEIGANKPFLL